TAAKPFLASLGEIAEIGVHGRHVRITRMKNDRNARRGETVPFPGDLAGKLGGHVAMHFGEIHARLLEYCTFHHYPGSPAAARFAFPHILAKLPAPVRAGQRRANPVLQLLKVDSGAALTFFSCHGSVPSASCFFLPSRRSREISDPKQTTRG